MLELEDINLVGRKRFGVVEAVGVYVYETKNGVKIAQQMGSDRPPPWSPNGPNK